jgi:hypothetical protein
MSMSSDSGFEYDCGRVDPGTRRDPRYAISETYLGDPIRIPVTVVNGKREGPTVFLSAASHADERNGIEVVREVACEWDLSDPAGTPVCLPVLNVPGFLAQQRYLPIYDRDLNRSFPGKAGSTSAKRMTARTFDSFVRPCDFPVGFHTTTRGRTNMLHVRADVSDTAVARLAQAFGYMHRDSGSLVSAGDRVCTLRTRSKATASPPKPRAPGCWSVSRRTPSSTRQSVVSPRRTRRRDPADRRTRARRRYCGVREAISGAGSVATTRYVPRVGVMNTRKVYTCSGLTVRRL